MKTQLKHSLVLLALLKIVSGSCPTGESELVVEITPDYFPGEISWFVTELCNKNVRVAEGEPLTVPLETTTTTLCLPNSMYSFEIDDWGEDGACCDFGDGGFKVTFAGTEITNGKAFGKQGITKFGTCTVAKKESTTSSKTGHSRL